MGLVWVKLWKQTEVAGKAAKFAIAQWAARNFAVVQRAGLLSWRRAMGRDLDRLAELPTPHCICSWMIFGQV